jgi:hypothetical protein
MLAKIEINKQEFGSGANAFNGFRVEYFNEKGGELRSEALITEDDIESVLKQIETRLKENLKSIQK